MLHIPTSTTYPSTRPVLRVVRDEESPPYDADFEPPTVRGAGFAVIPRAVLDLHDGYAFGVYVALASYANKAGECWPSLKTLAEATGWSDRHILRVIKRLEEAGVIERKQRFVGGMKSSTLYRIVAEKQIRTTVTTSRLPVVPDTNHSHAGYDSQSHKQEPVELDPSELGVTPPVSPKDPGKPKRIKTYLPDDFTVSDRMYDWAFNTYQLSSAQVDEKTERMRRYCLRNAKQYADWEQAWRGFMEPKPWDSSPAPPNGVHRNGSSNPSAQDFFARAAELAKEQR